MAERTPLQQRVLGYFDRLLWRLFIVATLLIPIHLGAMIILFFVPQEP